MDLFTIITIFVHVIAICVLVSTLPKQLKDIWSEQDERYRKISWVVFMGTFCLIAMNVLPLMQVFFYETDVERVFWNIINMFNGLIGMILGVLCHMMFSSTKTALPRTLDEIDTKRKQHD